MFFEILIVTLLGLVLGSFTSALIYRVPRDIAWAGPVRSACTHCKTALQPVDLLPLFSWLLARGRCRYCNEKIGARYPLTELTVLAGCLGAYVVFGLTFPAFFIMAAVPFLVALLVIDLEHMILPNQLVAVVGGIGFVRLVWLLVITKTGFSGLLVEHLGGAIIFAAIVWGLGWAMTNILKRDSLGFGDVKFFGVAGLWLGLSQLPWFCMAGGFLGVIWALAWQTLKKDKVFPFGPSLILSLYILLLLDGSLLL